MLLVEEGQRLAGLQRLQPQRHLGQLDGHRVDVDAVDAAADDAAQRGADHGVGRLGFAGFLGGEALGDPPGGGDEEVPGAAGGVADGDVEQRRDPFRGGPVGARLVEQRVERGVQQAVDQRGRRVVGAGLLALVAGQRLQRVGELLVVVAGDQLQQRLVDAAEFLGAEVAEVDPAPGAAAARFHQGQRADRAEQRLVGQSGAGERLVEREGAAVVAPEFKDAADAGQASSGRPPSVPSASKTSCTASNRSPCLPPRWRRASWRSRAEEKYVGVPVAGLAQPGPGVGVRRLRDRAGAGRRGPRRRTRTAAGRPAAAARG